MTATKEGIGIKGFSRVRIVNPDGSLHGDSGWVGPNQVTNLGFNDYICQTIGGMAGSKVITHALLGSGTAPGAADTSLEGEVEVRQTTVEATRGWLENRHGEPKPSRSSTTPFPAATAPPSGRPATAKS